MLLRDPFYGSLAMNWRVIEDSSIPTLRTNGPTLMYNPTFLASLQRPEQVGVVAHEILHCALKHVYRRGSRDPELWNEACDYVVNAILKMHGMVLPNGILYSKAYEGMTAEQVYSLLLKDRQKACSSAPGGSATGSGQQNAPTGKESQQRGTQTGSAGQGKSAQLPTGNFVDAPAEGEQNGGLSELDWELAVEQAARACSGAGHMPGGLELSIKNARIPRIDWISETRDFITYSVPTDFSFSRPNRRYIHSGVYLPGPLKENVGTLAVVIDSSGSTIPFLSKFAAGFQGLLSEARPEKIVLLYCDTAVSFAGEYGPDEMPELRPVGGGGTYFQPAFSYVAEMPEAPLAIIYLTDLDNADVVTEPDIPVLWITPEYVRKTAKFGRTIRLQED